ncbi:hypothetical protein L484_024202 [Morus notabilis]|uniref:Uncharacterized protein n=1 Tax=Morus notabilis TaxID=981085 RepID=W9RV81_9ROSA|nr:hypothetical protein L484_024202 [Morus notabilis]
MKTENLAYGWLEIGSEGGMATLIATAELGGSQRAGDGGGRSRSEGSRCKFFDFLNTTDIHIKGYQFQENVKRRSLNEKMHSIRLQWILLTKVLGQNHGSGSVKGQTGSNPVYTSRPATKQCNTTGRPVVCNLVDRTGRPVRPIQCGRPVKNTSVRKLTKSV